MVESCMSKHQPGHQPKGTLARQPAASWFPGTAGAGASQTGPGMRVDGVRHQGPRSLSGLAAGPLPEPWPLGPGGLDALAQPGVVAVPVRGTAEGGSEAANDLRPHPEPADRLAQVRSVRTGQGRLRAWALCSLALRLPPQGSFHFVSDCASVGPPGALDLAVARRVSVSSTPRPCAPSLAP